VARPRPREVGIRLGTLPTGRHNAIGDVPGVAVGHVSIVEGDAVRTGVTAIRTHPGDPFREKTPAAAFVLNGFGKTCGLPQVAELGVIETPILLTGTLSVPRVADALISWTLRENPEVLSVNPLVGECNDGYLNDIQGRHVRPEHVFAAIDGARSGPVEGGAVGAGVGMTCYGFKGGIGTASRLTGEFVVGALVLANFGARDELRIDGVPVGRELGATEASLLPLGEGQDEGVTRGGQATPSSWPSPRGRGDEGDGSCMVVLGTNAPLDARQLERLARRGGLGLARTGSVASHGSGDFILAFSNAEPVPHRSPSRTLARHVLAEELLTPVFQAVVEAVEEAVIDALFRADTTRGRDGHVRYALPVELTLEILRRHNRPTNR
jgi:D-aminopeptidase